jgi:hypothetical protein
MTIAASYGGFLGATRHLLLCWERMDGVGGPRKTRHVSEASEKHHSTFSEGGVIIIKAISNDAYFLVELKGSTLAGALVVGARRPSHS